MPDFDDMIRMEMDALLKHVLSQGREPLHFVIRKDDWRYVNRQILADRLANRLVSGLLNTPLNKFAIRALKVIGTDTYRGVPVHFGDGAKTLVCKDMPPAAD